MTVSSEPRCPAGAQLQRDIQNKRVIVCMGSGGVGKTTTSAVIALHAAIVGRRVLVLTVDPAKRLANSLGVDGIEDEAAEIPLSAFEPTGVVPKGQLFAMMLDMKKAFDRLVNRHAPDDETRERIYSNRFYKYFSNNLAGTQEYSAMERLYELYEESDYDLIVLDTPPTVNALDFLDAPKRFFEALDSTVFGWISGHTKPGRKAGSFFLKFTAAYAIRVLQKFTGSSFLTEFAEFINSFGDMWEGFKTRAARTKEILSGEDVAFYIVSSPESASLGEARFLHDTLVEAGIHVGGFVVNRVHQAFVPQPVLKAKAVEIQVRLQAHLDTVPDHQKKTLAQTDLLELSHRMQRNVREFHVLSRSDMEQVKKLGRDLKGSGAPMCTVPFFSTDIHSIWGLNRIRESLFGTTDGIAPGQRTPGRL